MKFLRRIFFEKYLYLIFKTFWSGAPTCSLCNARDGCTFSNENNCNLLQNGGTKYPNEQCPAPEITSIYPSNGPLDGGTRITISGTDLGVDVTTVSVFMRQSNRRRKRSGNQLQCEILKDEYVIAETIICKTKRVSNPANFEIFVKVGEKTSSPVQFSYISPKITEISPEVGVKSGGTLVTIKGRVTLPKKNFI